MKYKSYRIIDGKPRWVIVDETGNIVNRNPNKDELKGLKKEIYQITKRQQYTDNELLDYLRQFKKEERRVPTFEDFINNPGYPGSVTYQRRFGSWNAGLILSGLGIREIDKTCTYTDEELLDHLIRFEKENGRVPIEKDFKNNPIYPGLSTYIRRFGSWLNSLKLAGLDINLMGQQGCKYRGRQAEIVVLNHFKNKPIDLAGENQNSPWDGICPDGRLYDVKSTALEKERKYYHFNTKNKYKDKIEIYYLLAFNEDYTELDYAWKVPGNIVEKDSFYVGMNRRYEFNIENMEEFNITDKIIELCNGIY